jgi:ribose transport system ATP-binding protein
VIPALSATRLSKTFGATRVLHDVDLTVRPGEVHALVGANGSGKSTLIKILAGYHSPDAGCDISIAGAPLEPGSPESAYELGCRFVHQDLGLVDELSVVDNIFLSGGFPTAFGTLRRSKFEAEAMQLLERVGTPVDADLPVAELSAAAKTAVAMARALRPGNRHGTRLLVLDEPTATMPDDEVERLLGIVRRVAASGVGVLYVSHRLDEIFQVCDEVTILRDGHRVDTSPVNEYTHNRLVSALVGAELQSLDTGVRTGGSDTTNIGLGAEALTTELLHGISLSFDAGAITGIAGITGSGREAVLGSIFGSARNATGTVTVGGYSRNRATPADSIRAGVAYLPPDRKRLGGAMDATARENMSLVALPSFWKRWRLDRTQETARCVEWFQRLSVRPVTALERPLSAFSGGNQQKILFAKWLAIEPQVFLLDEPTQGVDVGAKVVLHQQLLGMAKQGKTVVVSSTDVEELAAICTRVVVLMNGHIVADLTGDDVTESSITRACLGHTTERA